MPPRSSTGCTAPLPRTPPTWCTANPTRQAPCATASTAPWSGAPPCLAPGSAYWSGDRLRADRPMRIPCILAKLELWGVCGNAKIQRFKTVRSDMKGYVFHGPGQAAWEEVADPGLEAATDAIVRVDAVTICGTDLHILKGDVPEVRPGTVLGHEAVGEIVEAGSDVRTVRPGDRVLVSCITSCGRCRFCRENAYGQCRGGGGWILGHLIDGTQAEYVRVPCADLSVHPLPAAVRSEDAVLFADIFPTSYEVGVLNGQVRPGDTVAIVGAGPIGLAAIATARLYSAAHIVVIDKAESRLRAAKLFGADTTVLAGAQDPLATV